MALLLALCQVSVAVNEDCVVVLRGGGVLHGAVTVQGERYIVSAPNRSIDVQAQQVLLIAPTMEAAYEQQRQQFTNGTCEPHLQLAGWCLRYDLLPQAEQEIAEARRIDPRDQRVNLLERRLTVARKPATPADSHPATVAKDEDVSTAELHELEDATSDLPKIAVERFTRKVQPLLVNNCTASGCHESGGEQKFQLDRAVLHGLGNRRITLRNLSATLDLVDRDSPERSELLAMARRAHGKMDHAAFGLRQPTHLKQLAEWVDLVAGVPVSPAPFEEPAFGSTMRLPSPESASLNAIPSRFLDPKLTAAKHEEEAPSTALPNNVKFGADLPPWKPKDAFDPDIFNRAQLGRESPPDMRFQVD